MSQRDLQDRQSNVGWREVHVAHGARKDVRVTLGDRTFVGPVVEIANDEFTIVHGTSRTTFLWQTVDAVEVLDLERPPVGQSENLNILPGGYFARRLEDR